MIIHDISRGLLASPVYPGDPSPVVHTVHDMAFGDLYNLTTLSLSSHNGTHLDAPLHFVPDGADIPSVPLTQVVGECTVAEFSGPILATDVEDLLPQIKDRRLLIKGEAWVTPSAAYLLSDLQLLGTEQTSVAPPEHTATVHRHLLAENTVLLENLDLSAVRPGTYFLVAAPLKVEGAEGAPVRAVLFEKETW